MAKKEKDKASWKYQNRNKDKAKSHNPSSTNTNHPQTQASKRDKHHENRQRSYLITGINATKIDKKNKDKNKVKDLNHIKYYTYKQKDNYANKCSKKAKN